MSLWMNFELIVKGNLMILNHRPDNIVSLALRFTLPDPPIEAWGISVSANGSLTTGGCSMSWLCGTHWTLISKSFQTLEELLFREMSKEETENGKKTVWKTK